jgi:hypothetical protein
MNFKINSEKRHNPAPTGNKIPIVIGVFNLIEKNARAKPTIHDKKIIPIKIINNISLLLIFILIHRYTVFYEKLKHLWVSLSSKETFVFDTPGKDAHLLSQIRKINGSVFYVCKSL